MGTYYFSEKLEISYKGLTFRRKAKKAPQEVRRIQVKESALKMEEVKYFLISKEDYSKFIATFFDEKTLLEYATNFYNQYFKDTEYYKTHNTYIVSKTQAREIFEMRNLVLFEPVKPYPKERTRNNKVCIRDIYSEYTYKRPNSRFGKRVMSDDEWLRHAYNMFVYVSTNVKEDKLDKFREYANLLALMVGEILKDEEYKVKFRDDGWLVIE